MPHSARCGLRRAAAKLLTRDEAPNCPVLVGGAERLACLDSRAAASTPCVAVGLLSPLCRVAVRAVVGLIVGIFYFQPLFSRVNPIA
jgi:hypothetical protein